MNIVIISHSYLGEENRKNIRALRKYANIRVVSPDSFRNRIFSNVKIAKKTSGESELSACKKISMFGSQYFLRSADLGFRKHRPDIVHVEYDPWSLMFLQTAAFKRIYAHEARIVCTIKNNTYRPYSAIAGRAKKKLAQAGISKVDRFIAVNQGVENIYRDLFGVPKEKIIRLQHLGVDVQLFRPRTGGGQACDTP